MRYDIDLLLLQAFSRMKMKTILGNHVSGERGKLAIKWKLFLGQEEVAEGNSKERKLAVIFSGNGEWGLTIGSLLLEPYQTYRLELNILHSESEWQSAHPKVSLNLSKSTIAEVKLLQQRFYLFSGGLALIAIMLLIFRSRISTKKISK